MQTSVKIGHPVGMPSHPIFGLSPNVDRDWRPGDRDVYTEGMTQKTDRTVTWLAAGLLSLGLFFVGRGILNRFDRSADLDSWGAARSEVTGGHPEDINGM